MIDDGHEAPHRSEKKTTRFFQDLGEQEDFSSEVYDWRRREFFWHMRAMLGLACAQAATLCIQVATPHRPPASDPRRRHRAWTAIAQRLTEESISNELEKRGLPAATVLKSATVDDGTEKAVIAGGGGSWAVVAAACVASLLFTRGSACEGDRDGYRCW